MRTLSWVLAGVAVAILVGGLVIDATSSEGRNMFGLYLVALAVAVAATVAGQLDRRRPSRP